MKKAISIALLVVTTTMQAQPVYVENVGFKLESIADIDIGWMKIYKHTTPPKEKTLGNRIYSAKQIGYGQQFIEWMQQSYMPKGCLGDVGSYQNEIPKFSSTNSKLGNEVNTHLHALPHMYAASSIMYTFLKKDAKGKFAPLFNFAEYWRIEVNQLQYISSPVTFISSPQEYYFVLPDFSSNPKGYHAGDKAASNLKGFNTQKNLQEHKHFYIPPKTIDVNPHYLVIMTKDHELPFEKVTIGEFFTQAEKQLPRWQKIDPLSAENFALAQKNLARLKEKYRNKWNDIAELTTRNTEINLQTFVNAREGDNDMFDNRDMYGKEGIYTTFPILKVKKLTRALCRTDEPQWLVIRWTVGMPSQPFNMHLHESILNNFNFDYVYNYFFDPEKVKGQTYKPLRSPSYRNSEVITEMSDEAKKNAMDNQVHFFEDFSTTDNGHKPIGWKSSLSSEGATAIVVSPQGLNGKWVMLNDDYQISFNQVKKPFPENFTLSFDLAASQNFTWGAKGMKLILAKETSAGNAESFLLVKLRPGFDGKEGETYIETKFPFPSGYSNETKWFAAPGFSNNKKYNRIAVSIRKTGEKLTLMIDQNKIAEYSKGLPAAHLFNAISFSSASSGENNKYYISNIKITKE